MVNRFGIIDLGSNTFHLLIVDYFDEGFSQVFKERVFVGLAEDGIEMLSARAMKKGLSALKEFKSILKKYEVKDFKAIGTAALRSASNSVDFVAKVYEELGIDIEVIKGLREAELIYKGVSLISELSSHNHMIMDVGGGSVEFILIKDGKLTWAKSYNIGVGVLHNGFHNTDPIDHEDIFSLNTFIEKELKDLIETTRDMEIQSIIGASGSFEVVQSMNNIDLYSNKTTTVDLNQYFQVSEKIISSTLLEREQMPGLPASRVKLIVVAMILINKAINIIQPKALTISPYALKEGVLCEMKR